MDRTAVVWFPDPSDGMAEIYWDGQRWNGRRELLPRPTYRPVGGADRIDMDQIRDLLIKVVPSAQDVCIDESDEKRDIQFQFLDDEGDPVEVILFRYDVDSRLLVLFTQAAIDDDYDQVRVLRACNAWNADHYPHQTACFLTITDEDHWDAVWLQSSLLLPDSPFEEVFKGWVNDFLASIDEWQYVVLDALGLFDDEQFDESADRSDISD